MVVMPGHCCRWMTCLVEVRSPSVAAERRVLWHLDSSLAWPPDNFALPPGSISQRDCAVKLIEVQFSSPSVLR